MLDQRAAWVQAIHFTVEKPGRKSISMRLTPWADQPLSVEVSVRTFSPGPASFLQDDARVHVPEEVRPSSAFSSA